MERRLSKRRLLRDRVAEIAARLLYEGKVKEYLEAKRIAQEELNTSTLPANIEVAQKLLEVALEAEGERYWERLKEMRLEALELMEPLAEFRPRLVGSVWRGVLKPHSDIDLELDQQDPAPVIKALTRAGYQVEASEKIGVPEPLRQGSIWRIRTRGRRGTPVEIILKGHEHYVNPLLCDIYGEPKKGLTLGELRKVLEETPEELFIPRRIKPWR